MRDHYAQLRDLGAEVLVISFAKPKGLAGFLAEQSCPFPVVCDPELRAYHAFGLEDTTIGAMLCPGPLWRFLKLVARGWLPRRGNREDSVFQLGGDFLLDHERRLVWAHRSTEPTDRPTSTEIIRQVQKLVQA